MDLNQIIRVIFSLRFSYLIIHLYFVSYLGFYWVISWSIFIIGFRGWWVVKCFFGYLWFILDWDGGSSLVLARDEGEIRALFWTIFIFVGANLICILLLFRILIFLFGNLIVLIIYELILDLNFLINQFLHWKIAPNWIDMTFWISLPLRFKTNVVHYPIFYFL